MIEEKNPEILMDDDDLIDLVDDNGRHLKFFHVGSTQFLNKWYAFFMPAEDIEGVDESTVVIFEVIKDDKGEEALIPVEDELILEQVYEKFCREMEEEADSAEAEEMEGGCCCGHHHGEDCCEGEDDDCHCHHEEDHEGECHCHHEEDHEGECHCYGKGKGHKDGSCHGHGKKGGCKKGNH